MRVPPRRLNAALLCLVVVGLRAPTVSAQERGFVEAGALLDVDPTQRSQTTTTSGLTAAAGLFTAPHLSLRLEFELPGWHASDYEGRARVASHIEAYSQREEGRSPSVSVLVGFNVRPLARLDIALLAGGTRAKRATRSRGFTERYTLDGVLVRRVDFDRTDDEHEWFAVSGGVDAAVQITKHLAVVPQLRLHSYIYSEHTSELFFRPRLSLRWRF